jgi:poly [ADP-ribose] polymerase
MDYGYRGINLDYSKAEIVADPIQTKPSELNKSLVNLMELIFSMDMMNKQMRDIGYNAAKLPLGQLGKDTLQKGYAALSKIEDVLVRGEKGDVYEMSSEFYSHIPHSFGFK